MGCFLCKTIAGRIGGPRSSRRTNNKDKRRESEQQAVAAQNEDVDRGIEELKSSEAPVSVTVPEFRLRRGLSTVGEVWPAWLIEVAGHVVRDWKPRRANTFEKLDKIGSGTYSNVYKAKDLISGKVVALKKVRFDNLEPETVRFMAREILVLRRLKHPNVITLEGLVTSRLSSSLYLVFQYMEHDLAGLASVQSAKFTEPQVKCFIKQLLSGLEHCHNNNVLHRDIKCSNLLIDDEGILRIADFGLASFFDPERKKPMTSRVITLWYRPPELLLGATHYGVGVDLWSAGCILAELFAGKPILRGRTEIEQLHKIFKLCGSPSEEYWKKSRFPNATLYKPQQPYKRCVRETFKDFPPYALALVDVLLSIDPEARGTATSALNSEFFTSEPYACDPSSLPKFPPSKEMDIKLRDEEARRQRGLSGKSQITDGNNNKRSRVRDKVSRAIPAPEANAEIQANIDRMRIMDAKAKSKSEKFPPPHQDGEVGHHHHHHHHTLDASRDVSFSTQADSNSFYSAIFNPKLSTSLKRPISKNTFSRRKVMKDEQPHAAPSRSFINALYPSIGWDFRFSRRRTASENFVDRR